MAYSHFFMKYILIFLIFSLSSPIFAQNERFSEEALKEDMISRDGDAVDFASILKENQGKEILIDFWASWCKDCIQGFPHLKELQENNPQLVYVFLSLDKDVTSWKEGIERFNLKGEHYFVKAGWKGELGKSVNLDWIPRYMLIDKNGKIKLNRAITTTDQNLTKLIR